MLMRRVPALIRLTPLLVVMLHALGCIVQPTPPKTYWTTLDGERPVVIAHRGDSGAYPEHTLLAYGSALKQGADLIEPDVVLTKDGVAICRHEPGLSRSTDIVSAGLVSGGGNDASTRLTLAQVKRLRAVQPVEGRPGSPVRLSVPTLAEAVELVQRDRVLAGSDAGLYIEIKSPVAHRDAGLDISRAVLDVLGSFEQAGGVPKVVLQCFDREECERLAAMTDYPVVWLSSEAVDMTNLPEGIAGLGLEKSLIELVEDEDSETGMRAPLVEAAHAKGLAVHAWTFRDDRLGGTGYDDAQEEIEDYLRAGVDGVFTDFPATGVQARRAVEEQWADPTLSSRFRKGRVAR